jgi:hypothetical protein
MPQITKSEKLKRCRGCRNDFYNGNNKLGVRECWSLKSAKPVRRWRIGWWTTPDTPRAFEEVETLSCHHAPGQYGSYEKLPTFAVDPIRMKK